MDFNENEFKYENIIKTISKAIESDGVFHAYCFQIKDELFAKRFVQWFTKKVLCQNDKLTENEKKTIRDKITRFNHEDLIIINHPDESIKNEEITEIQKKIRMKPYGQRHIVIVYGAERMTLSAQNRLLKTLEEPVGNTIVVLITENIEELIITIRSRCVKFIFESHEDKRIRFNNSKISDFIKELDSDSKFFKLKPLIERHFNSVESTEVLLDELEFHYRNLLINPENTMNYREQSKLINIIANIEKARADLKQGLKPIYIIKKLVFEKELEIGGEYDNCSRR